MTDTKPITEVPKPEVSKKPSTTPWKRASMLETPIKIPGFIIRWVSPTQVEKKLYEGWEFVDQKKDISAPLPSIDGSKMDSRVRMRELILMKLPVERKKAREDFYKKRSKELLDSSINTFEDDSNKLTGIHKSSKGAVYGSYNIEKKTEE